MGSGGCILYRVRCELKVEVKVKVMVMNVSKMRLSVGVNAVVWYVVCDGDCVVLSWL